MNTDYTDEPISKHPLSKSALICPVSSLGSNFNPRNTTCIYPKGIYYAAPVVNPPEADRLP